MNRASAESSSSLSWASDWLFRNARATRAAQRLHRQIKPRLSPGFCFASVIQEASELPAPARMLQFPERLRLDLPDALAGDRKLLADFLQRVVGVHADAETHAQHALLARRQ